MKRKLKRKVHQLLAENEAVRYCNRTLRIKNATIRIRNEVLHNENKALHELVIIVENNIRHMELWLFKQCEGALPG